MKMLVSYDITDDRRRERAVRILLDYGQRVQDSVFWLDAEEDLIERMRSRIHGAIDPETDSVWIVPLCEACARKLETAGVQVVPQVPSFYVV